MQSLWTRVDGLDMHAVVNDDANTDAPIVVLVHGLGMSSRYMMPTARLLSAHTRVFAIDLPGFGLSEKPHRALDVAELSDRLAAWMQVTGVQRAAFVGNSFGAQIIVDFAVRYPQQVERAVLIAPTIDRHARTFSRQVWRLILDAPREPPSLIPIALSDYLRAGIARAARTLRYALADRVEEKLPLVRAPMLVVRGGRDPIVPQHWVEEATRLLPAARLEVIAQSAHAVNYDAPEELVRVMLPFLMNVENDSYCSGSANTKIKVSDII